ncbi:MAG: ADP-ribose pyrophosphatase [Gemmatimonadetes bacterium]|nr:ADP-ribose pyrophosphatase [Gemmatimonadota bacterium]
MTRLSSTRPYAGRRISVDLDTVRFPDGSVGTLEMVRHPGASAVVPFLDDPADPDPRVILIRQYRHAADGYLWEIPAGTLDPGDTPDGCARRELREEAGCEAGTLEHLATIYTTPGFTDERIHLYAASGLHRVAQALEADEFLETHEVRWSEVGRMIRQGEIADGKSLSALMYMQCFRRHH